MNVVTPVFSGFYNGFASTVVAGMVGVGVGGAIRMPATFGTQMALLNLFWKYVVPHTFGRIFFQKENNLDTNIWGAGVSYLASLSIPYLYNRLVTHIKIDTPYIGKLAKEAKKRDAGLARVIIPVASGMIGLTMAAHSIRSLVYW